jgi:putative lipoic acid-binding regulatory protein
MNESGCKIAYPCRWVYKIIGSDQELMRKAIVEIAGGQEYAITPSRSSKGQKYHSLNLEMNIGDDESRVSIYEALRKHPEIKFVL